MRQIREIIQKLQNPELTLTTFLKSPELERLLHEYNQQGLAQLHPSFSNLDSLAAEIKRNQLLLYPAGRDLHGLQYQVLRNEKLQDYVRYIYRDDNRTLIICARKEQLELLYKLESFEVDMSFKRLRCGGLKEIVFATQLPGHSGKSKFEFIIN
ncbi:hypothetical protein EYZ11_009881 [Aspergillus tanneri]|uniref:Uncharacterized protein n=1 Tax=Aspergillus tanneri TaxID=1220188 RepID=A0A4S3J6R5_9EURO|nr:hypothetical protein EYZ11_009881 [Aspergillus tanneri]